MKRHLKLLGMKAEDKVTGFKGVITSISFDINGCIQGAITPTVNDKGEIDGGKWFDVLRLKISDDKPVCELADFDKNYIMEGKKGSAEKPMK